MNNSKEVKDHLPFTSNQAPGFKCCLGGFCFVGFSLNKCWIRPEEPGKAVQTFPWKAFPTWELTYVWWLYLQYIQAASTMLLMLLPLQTENSFSTSEQVGRGRNRGQSASLPSSLTLHLYLNKPISKKTSSTGKASYQVCARLHCCGWETSLLYLLLCHNEDNSWEDASSPAPCLLPTVMVLSPLASSASCKKTISIS